MEKQSFHSPYSHDLKVQSLSHLEQCCTYPKHFNFKSIFLELTHTARKILLKSKLQLTLKRERERVLSQKIGTFDRNNLNCHGHKQTQMENVVLFCSELNTFTSLKRCLQHPLYLKCQVTLLSETMEAVLTIWLTLFQLDFGGSDLIFMFIQ